MGRRGGLRREGGSEADRRHGSGVHRGSEDVREPAGRGGVPIGRGSGTRVERGRRVLPPSIRYTELDALSLSRGECAARHMRVRQVFNLLLYDILIQGLSPSRPCGLQAQLDADSRKLETLIPDKEMKVLHCLLEDTTSRAMLRSRLASCLRNGHFSDGDRRSEVPSVGANQFSSAATGGSGAAMRAMQLLRSSRRPRASGQVADDAAVIHAVPNVSRLGDVPGVPKSSPILTELRLSKSNEEALVSSPVGPPSGNAGMIPALVSSAAERGEELLTITCTGNGKFLAPDPEQPPETISEGIWIACAGDAEGGTTGIATPLHDGLFAREPLRGAGVAFRHVASGRYLQVCCFSHLPHRPLILYG